MNTDDDHSDNYNALKALVPERFQKELGNFNVFRRKSFTLKRGGPVPFSYRNYFKIVLLVGHTRLHYADRTVETGPVSLLFSTPQVPYTWESLEESQAGYFCIFSPKFFNHFGTIGDYPVFLPGWHHLFDLTDKQYEHAAGIYERMLEELNSEYTYKYDVIRMSVLELVHIALKISPSTVLSQRDTNGSHRIAALFTELLEQQFPIESPLQLMEMRSPADYAGSLSVHVNHLNRCLIKVTGKTTSELIKDRIGMEARILLRQTTWNISEIGYCLGFSEPSYFTSFFKKHFGVNPTKYRSNVDV